MQCVIFSLKRFSLSLFAITLLSSVVAHAASNVTAPVQVMIVGAYHMGNPGQDLNNAKVDSVLTPDKQKQLVDAVNALAKFKPNKIAVEMVAKNPDMTTHNFEKFTPDLLLKEPNEITQIAYRMAHQLGHKVVYAIDEQSETIDYFPYSKVEEFAKANNQTALLERGQAWGKKSTEAFEKKQKIKTVRQLLLEMNMPGRGMEEMREAYYPMIAVGNDKAQPGAELNAFWYQRNAKIFTKLNLVAKPGDKILVLFGAGHNYWLRHFVSQMPDYQLVEANRYLK
jgi:hypothetical protein